MQSTEVNKITLKKNDQVQVIAGRDKGKIGKITAIDMASGRVTVEKANMVKRHLKPSQKNPQGGITEKELPIHASNVLLHCPKCNRGVRHGMKLGGAAAKGKKGETTKAQKKTRVCKRCGESLDAL